MRIEQFEPHSPRPFPLQSLSILPVSRSPLSVRDSKDFNTTLGLVINDRIRVSTHDVSPRLPIAEAKGPATS